MTFTHAFLISYLIYLEIYIIYDPARACIVSVSWTQYSPPEPDSRRVDPIESISSMKIIDGACSLQNISNTMNWLATLQTYSVQ